ncbi:MAG: DNA-binding protein [Lachnospiraceae bacterium]|nr:DNA-binding protein [Lachnospiraceae bacterium]MBR4993030.1 DNA-binding protein [Lachnospiraceae bacterium]
MEKIVEQGLLYDYYGELLTEHQKKIYEDVVYNNLSLNEIAEDEGISKQGVHDLVKRCDKTLSEYEEKLKLIERGNKASKLLDELDKMNLPGEALSKLKDIRELI